MQIVVKANEQQKSEWLLKGNRAEVTVIWISADDSFSKYDADAYFDLMFNEENIPANELAENSTVFANTVAATCKELPENYTRINAWSGFLNRNVIETASCNDLQKQKIEKVLHALGWNFMCVADAPGMIAARILSMVINEAYFTFGDAVSSKQEIDTAMKLGTNYPYGPFEWSEKIGLDKIYRLLKTLDETDPRYTPAPAMEEEIFKAKKL